MTREDDDWLDLRIAAREDGRDARARELDEEEDRMVDQYRKRPKREDKR